MKYALTAILWALVLNVALAQNVNTKDRWVQVEGGAWVPAAEMVEKIKGQIESFVRNQASVEGRILPAWKNYTFQYQGQEERGRKVVFVNAFCADGSRWKVHQKMVFVFDGGACFFSVKYDPDKGRFFDLFINGDG